MILPRLEFLGSSYYGLGGRREPTPPIRDPRKTSDVFSFALFYFLTHVRELNTFIFSKNKCLGYLEELRDSFELLQ